MTGERLAMIIFKKTRGRRLLKMVPTREQCIQMLSDYNISLKVKRHSLMAAHAAVCLAKLLNSSGYRLNLQAVEAAALLHDIAKGRRNHPQAGAEILAERGYVKTAEIIRQHMRPDSKERGRISEVTVVYLADKFVDDDKIVTLEQRFTAKRDSYCKSPEALEPVKENYRIALELQDIIQGSIGCHEGIYDLLLQKFNQGIGGMPG